MFTLYTMQDCALISSFFFKSYNVVYIPSLFQRILFEVLNSY